MVTLVAALVLAPGSKLVIKDLKVGQGPAAKAGDVLTMLYRGTLKNGKVFDETTPKKPPLAFTLGAKEVIPGWDQGLVGMKVGGRRRLSIPSALAYGASANGDIPANSDLFFDVELLRIDTKATDSKLVIKETKAGSGPTAKKGDTVKIHYTGKFLNGFVFDSSVGKAPISFVLGGGKIIKGFDTGVTGMKKGGKRTITIPYKIADGDQGRQPVIPPKSTLVFDLELVSIN
jgi:FKBP-type peptidyl-prolyl cis-trans isomerase